MNTLRRISRVMVKAVAASAVMIAAALPVAIASTAGATTAAPTLACTSITGACTSGYAIIGQGYSGTFYFNGAGFANDAAVGGNVAITTTAPGVTFSSAAETSGTDGTATITSSSTSTPGFYSVTLTDSNGSVTLPLGLGIDHGPQITAVAGNSGTAGGAASTVTVTGSFLNGATSVTFAGAGAPTASAVTPSSDGTSLTFVVNNSGASAGSYAFTINGAWQISGYGAVGSITGSYTVNASATPVTITAVSPSVLGIPTSGGSVPPAAGSTSVVTVSGTGFEAGAVITLTAGTGVNLISQSFVNSTTMTLTVGVDEYSSGTTPVAPQQANIKVTNPDTTYVTGTGILGIGEAAASTSAGPVIPVAPTISVVSGSLTPGTSTILHVVGSSSFPLTTGSTVSVAVAGVTNTTEILSGTVLSVDATNTATIRVIVPRYAATTLATASAAAATSLVLANTSGMPTSGSVTVFDGASSEVVTYTGISGNTLTGVSATAFAHAAGVTVEFLFPASTNYILTVNNGVNSETTPVTVNAAAAATFTSTTTGAPLTTLTAGSYSINAYVPGFGFTTGSAVTFGSNGITGTVSVVNGNTATLNVTVPASTPLSTTLASAATAGQSAVVLTAVTGLVVGSHITIQPDTFYATSETVTVTSISGTGPYTVGITPALVSNHSSGATVTGLSGPQATSGAVSIVLTNGSGRAYVNSSFFSLSPVGTATASFSPVGAGAMSAPENFTTSFATGDSTASDWTVTSTTAGVTFGAVTNSAASNISTTVSVAAGTPANASVPVLISDGFTTFTSSLAIVAGPTVTSVTAVGNLSAGGSENIGVAGTNFNATDSNNSCSTSDPAVTCTINVGAITNSTTSLSVHIVVGAAALNGTDAIIITDNTTMGSGQLATGVTVSGQPAATSISPTVVPVGTGGSSSTLLTVTGTGFSGTYTCSLTYTYLATGGTYPGYSCSATVVNATTIQITSYFDAFYGYTMAFTLSNGTSTFTTPSVATQLNPSPAVMVPDSIVANSPNVPFILVGSGFLPGTTLSIPAADGTVTVTEITPDAIFGTISIAAGATVGVDAVTITATNTNGGVGSTSFDVVAAPTISGTPYIGVSGASASLVITGTGFYPGAVVSTGTSGFATFGTAVASNCTGTGPCTTLTVPVTWVQNASASPIGASLTVTNPVGLGAVTVANGLTVNPGPMPVGVYYVPTFSSNVLVNIQGTGFQAGMTCTSSNVAYTLGVVGVTPTTLTLLVSTTSAATAGTFTNVTCVNPDGGTVSFHLNGGPVPSTTILLHAIKTIGHVTAGKTVTIHILGTGFYGQPSITSHKGTVAHVSGDTGTLLTVRVSVKAGSRNGIFTFTITLANGQTTHVKYVQR